MVFCKSGVEGVKAMTQKEGLYISYNEEENGLFDEAVEISNKLGCLTWFIGAHRNPERLHYPTVVFVRLTGRQGRCLRGTLLAIASAATLDAGFADGERNHRPPAWREGKKDFRSVLSSVAYKRFQSLMKSRIRSLQKVRPTWLFK
jgi:hypothetical protein